MSYSKRSSETVSVNATTIVSSDVLFSFPVDDLGEYQLEAIDITWSADGNSWN